MKKYCNNWPAKKLIINFNHKQWRQDFAAYVKMKKIWTETKVTRSTTINNNSLDKGVKSFEVYNQYGGSIKVIYQNCNNVIKSTDEELINQYFNERTI